MMKLNLPDFSFITNYQNNNLTMILCCLCIGIFIASSAALYRQYVLGGIIKRIIDKGASSEETALTFSELGYTKKNILNKSALSDKSTFIKNINTVKKEGGKTAYFIPEEKQEQIKNRFVKKGNTPTALILGILLLVTAAFFCLTIIPLFADKIKEIL